MVAGSASKHGVANVTEKVIYLIVAVLIWLPLVADQFLLESKLVVGNVEQISTPVSGSHKGFETIKIRIKTPNKYPVEYSINPYVAKKLMVNHLITIYESRLLFRVLKIEQDGVVLSNNYGGLNMAILVAIFSIPAYFFLLLGMFFFRKLRYKISSNATE